MPPGVDAGPQPDAGDPPPIPDAGACMGMGIADALTVTAVSGTSGSGPVFGAPTGTGAVLGWRGSDGIHLTPVDGAGGRAAADVVIAGNAIWGLAAHDDILAAIVDRGSDELVLSSANAAGASRFELTLIGDVDHGVTNNEWFGTGIRAARLAWTGTQWAAYYTVQRLWDDGVAHYGDQLRLFEDDGSPARTVWGWGCSHSMEVRITHNGMGLGPVCASDCFPAKGVHFNHRTLLYPDPLSNCGGRYEAHLGGVVPMGNGFWVGFSSPEGRPSRDAAIIHVGNDRTVGSPIWLTDGAGADDLHIGRMGAGLILAWIDSGANRMVRADAAGAMIGTPEAVPEAALAAAGDFFLFTGGDVGWATRVGGEVALARLRDCE